MWQLWQEVGRVCTATFSQPPKRPDFAENSGAPPLHAPQKVGGDLVDVTAAGAVEDGGAGAGIGGRG